MTPLVALPHSPFLGFERHQMGGLAAVLVIGAVAGGFAWLMVRARRTARQANFDRSVRARKLGWRYDGIRDGPIDYRFAGEQNGIAWSMWYDSERGDDSPTPKGIWTTKNVRVDRLSLVIIGRKRYSLESGSVGRLLMGVVSGVTNALRGSDDAPDKVEFYEASLLLEEGGPIFREHFAIAQRHEMPRRWLDDTIQRALLQWPEPERGARLRPEDAVEVTLDSRGLTITVQKMPDDMLHWQHLAALGQQLATRLIAASG